MIVLVGASGFLGSRLISALTPLGPILPIAGPHHETRGLSVDMRSLEDVQRLIELARGNTVVYCANVGGRRAADEDPTAAETVNATVPSLLAEVADHIVYFSTDYVFPRSAGPKGPGDIPAPSSHYGQTKYQGERAVLCGSARSAVIRVSGLYDEQGTRVVDFSSTSSIEAPDDIASQPTYIPSLASFLAEIVRSRSIGIYHCCGPELLSRYEFLQLASLPWGFSVVPVVANAPIGTELLPSSTWTKSAQSPGAVFGRMWRDNQVTPRSTWPPKSSDSHAVVLDTIGVLLGQRRWKHPDPDFWHAQEMIGQRRSEDLSAEEVAVTVGAYTLNPRGIHILRHLGRGPIIAANNGPVVTFKRWVQRFGLHALVDHTMNSERDGVAKPSREFFRYVRQLVGASSCPGLLIDDRIDIVTGARVAGWQAVQTEEVTGWPIACFDLLDDGEAA